MKTNNINLKCKMKFPVKKKVHNELVNILRPSTIYDQTN